MDNDLISRSILLNFLDEVILGYKSYNSLSSDFAAEVAAAIKEYIARIPAADTERHGKWEPCGTPGFSKCNMCGRMVLTLDVQIGLVPYCHCGAKMDEEKRGADDAR